MLDTEEYQNLLADLAFSGKGTYKGVEFRVDFLAPDISVTCNACYNRVVDHPMVVLLANFRALYRVCPDRLVEDYVDVMRADGDVICLDCDKPFWKHYLPESYKHTPSLRVLCSGEMVKL